MTIYKHHTKPYNWVDRFLLPSVYFCVEYEFQASNDAFRLGVRWLGHDWAFTVVFNKRF